MPQRRPTYPTWTFRRCENGPHGWWSDCDLADLIERLKSFELMNGQQLAGAGCHELNHDSLSKAARDRFEELFQGDPPGELWSFRVKARERVHGVWTSTSVELLWWDPGHQVCPSPKKHT